MIMKLRPLFSIVFFLSFSFYSFAVHAEGQSLSSLSYKVISAAQESLSNGQPKDAIKKIRPLLSKIKDKPYDQAVAFQTLGFAFYEAKDSKNAKAAFAKAIGLNVLPNDVQQKLLFNLTKIYSLDNDDKQAKTYLEKWLNTKPKMDADGSLLAAMVYYNLQQYQSMIPHLKSAIKLKKNAPINWYELLGSAYIQIKQYKNAASVYEALVRKKSTDKQLWLQLATIYQLANNSKKSLAISELAYKKGLFQEKEILNLANNYNYHSMPFKAGSLLEKELSNGSIKRTKKTMELLANSWILAQEHNKAINTLVTISKNNPSSDIKFRLGQLYYETEQWKQAIDALKTVVEDKNYKFRSKALLFLGIAAYENNDMTLSERSFTRALSYKQTRSSAEQWLRQLKTKQANS